MIQSSAETIELDARATVASDIVTHVQRIRRYRANDITLSRVGRCTIDPDTTQAVADLGGSKAIQSHEVAVDLIIRAIRDQDTISIVAADEVTIADN